MNSSDNSKNHSFSTKESTRLQKLEFIHNIGLIPILKMGKVDPAGNFSNLPKIKVDHDIVDENSGSVMEVETVGGRESNRAKTYEELLAENEDLKTLLNQKLAEVEKNHEMIMDENELLSKELLDMKRREQETKNKWEEKLRRSNNERDVIREKFYAMRKVVLGMNSTLMGVLEDITEPQNLSDLNLSISDEESEIEIMEALKDLEACSSPGLPKSSNFPPVTPSSAAAEGDIPNSREESLPSLSLKTSLDSSVIIIPTNTENSSESKYNTPTLQPVRRSVRVASVSKKTMIPAIATPETAPDENSTKVNKVHSIDSTKDGYYCICGFLSNSRANLLSHISYYAHHLKNFHCTVQKCDQSYYKIGDLTKHMQTKHGIVHLTKKTIGCRKCGKAVTTRAELFAHIRTVHRNSAESMTDEELPVSQNTPSPPVARQKVVAIRSVAEITRLGKRKTRLDSTGAGGTMEKPSKTQEHGKDPSAGVNTHVCLCGRVFAKASGLYHHVQNSVLGKQFPCEHCKHKFHGTNQLRYHMKTKHNMAYTGYGCRACGKIFQSLPILTKHLIVHRKKAAIVRSASKE